MEELTVTIYPAEVEEELARNGYKPTPERVEKVLRLIAGSDYLDTEKIVLEAIEYLMLPGDEETGLGEQDG